MSQSKPAPVGGPIMTRPFKVLLGIFLAGAAAMLYRFALGLGPATALNDGYPWGIWIAFDVVTGTALACGGYAVALLCYIFNKGKYHPLVRPAILTSALGYTMAAFSIVLDVGRYWRIWMIPLSPQKWNGTSILLEVALCVMSYMIVLYIELSPAFMEKWKEGKEGTLKSLSETFHPVVEKALPFIIALGLLLPTMHQSSLGTLTLISRFKLHPLWFSPLAPLLFLLSCVSMGYAAVVIESSLATRYYNRPRETKILADISGVMLGILGVYLVLRLADLAVRGRLGLFFSMDRYSLYFLVELCLFAAPILLLRSRQARENPKAQFHGAMLMVLAGGLYRFNAYIVAFNPGDNWSYFPSVLEMLVTFGIIALEIMLYLVVVKRFPILGGAAPAPRLA